MATRATLIKRRERLQLRYDQYLAAEQAILEGAQSYTIGSRSLTRADLGTVEEMIAALEDQIDAVDAELAGRGRYASVATIPRDW